MRDRGILDRLKPVAPLLLIVTWNQPQLTTSNSLHKSYTNVSLVTSNENTIVNNS